MAIVAEARSPSGSEKEIEPLKIAGVVATYTASGENCRLPIVGAVAGADPPPPPQDATTAAKTRSPMQFSHRDVIAFICHPLGPVCLGH
jgi:hypothetical protein